MAMQSGRRWLLRTCVVVCCSLPWLMGAETGEGCAPAPIGELGATVLPRWLAACKTIQFTAENTQIDAFAAPCEEAQFSAGAHATCDKDTPPAFFVVDGVIFGSEWNQIFDPSPFQGKVRPNISEAIVVNDLDPRTKKPGTFVFGGIVPIPDSSTGVIAATEAPKAFALKIDPAETALSPLVPLQQILPIPLEPNEGCGSLHIAVAASKSPAPATLTAFVATCLYVYRFQRDFRPDGESWILADGPQTEGAIDQVPLEKMPPTQTNNQQGSVDTPVPARFDSHRRSELEVVPISGGYVLVWSYETMDGTDFLRAVQMDNSGFVMQTAETRVLDAASRGSTKGIEITHDARTVYFTHPAAPEELLSLPLLDNGKLFPLSIEFMTRTKLILGVGFSQIEMAVDGNLYLFGETPPGCLNSSASLVGVAVDSTGVVGFASQPLLGSNIRRAQSKKDWPNEDIWLLPDQVDGYTYGCESLIGQ